MALEMRRRLVRVALHCDDCGTAFSIEADPAIPDDTHVWEVIMKAKENGWVVVRRENNDVFALCKFCAEDLLDRVLMSAHDAEVSRLRDWRSARRPVGGNPLLAFARRLGLYR